MVPIDSGLSLSDKDGKPLSNGILLNLLLIAYVDPNAHAGVYGLEVFNIVGTGEHGEWVEMTGVAGSITVEAPVPGTHLPPTAVVNRDSSFRNRSLQGWDSSSASARNGAYWTAGCQDSIRRNMV
jgi:hypothetical protein